MPGRLIVFAGPPCSGKTTLARMLAERTGAPHLAMDETRERLLPGAAHTRADRQVAYRAMAWAAELLLTHGVDVILDAPYWRAEDRRELEQLRELAPLYLIQCLVSPEVALERFHSRPLGPRLDLTEEAVVQLVESFPVSPDGLQLHTDHQTPAACLAAIEAYL